MFMRVKNLLLVTGRTLQAVILFNLEHCYVVQVPLSNKIQLVAKTFVKEVR